MSRIISALTILAATLIPSILSAEHIVDEHIKAVGGAEKIAAVKTIQRSGQVKVSGGFGEFQGTVTESTDVAGSKGYQLIDVVIAQIESGWSEKAGWRIAPQQGVTDMSEEELRMSQLNGGISAVASVKKMLGMKAFGEPKDETFNDQDCVQVEVIDTPLVLYINKETKMLAGIEAGERATFTFEDYKDVDGIQFPQKVTTEAGGQGVTIVNDYEQTELNGELDESLFEKPELDEPETEEAETEEPAPAE